MVAAPRARSGTGWSRCLSRPALAVDLPGRAGKPTDPMTFSVDEGVRSVLADVDRADIDRVILVAHSSGGLFVPGVAAGLGARTAHIVLSAASVPPEGGLGLDCMKASHRERTVAAIEAARRDGWTLTTPGPPDDAETMRDSYGETLDDETLRVHRRSRARGQGLDELLLPAGVVGSRCGTSPSPT